MQRKMRQRRRGLTDMDYARMEEVGDTLSQAFFQLQRNVESPIFHFRNIVGKIAYVASLLLKLCFLAGAILGLGQLASVISRRWFRHEINWSDWLERGLSSGWMQLLLLLVSLVVIRRIIIRLNQPDTRLQRDRG